MHSIVCTKQVSDSAQVRVNPLTNTIVASGGQASSTAMPSSRSTPRTNLRDKFGGEITALTTVDAERRAGAAPNAACRCCAQSCGSTMAEATSQICRAVTRDAPACGAGAGRKMEGAGGRRRGVSKCVVLGSPTIVKRAFAPSLRAEKVGLVEDPKQPMEVLMKAILKGQPKLETDLVAQARRF
ncbi:hypothetical protein [Bradyrhizobium murdochi]|uniref:hypothetical protein n=1 Tax=Bradyrhizobium murdochi TaxID=1038859 RepID=UPI000686CCE9